MFIHLVKYVIEAAVARITSLVTPQEVKGLAVERLVALGTSPGGAAPEVNYEDLAGEINYPSLVRCIEYDDLAGVLDYDLLGEGAAASLDYGKLAGRIDYAALGRCILAPEGDTAPAAPEIDYEKLAEAVRRRAPEAPALAPAPAPESPSIESTFGAALSARLLAAAVERLLLIADETIRDGKL